MKRDEANLPVDLIAIEAVTLAGGCLTIALATAIVLIPALTPFLGAPEPGPVGNAVLTALSILAPLSFAVGRGVLMSAARPAAIRRSAHARRTAGKRAA